MDLDNAFEWFSQPSDQRDSNQPAAIKRELRELWSEVRERIGAERFDSSLGEVRAGKRSRSDDSVWTQTNGERSQGDYVNLTLELHPDELSLNVIGWFDPQHKNGNPNFQGASGEERERIPIGDTGAAHISTMLTELRPKLEPGREKPALHIRRAWSPGEVASSDDLAGSIATEVEAWLYSLERIRLS